LPRRHLQAEQSGNQSNQKNTRSQIGLCFCMAVPQGCIVAAFQANQSNGRLAYRSLSLVGLHEANNCQPGCRQGISGDGTAITRTLFAGYYETLLPRPANCRRATGSELSAESRYSLTIDADNSWLPAAPRTISTIQQFAGHLHFHAGLGTIPGRTCPRQRAIEARPRMFLFCCVDRFCEVHYRICTYTTNNNERENYGSSEARTKSRNLQRTMCRQIKETQGEGRIDGRRRSKSHGRQQEFGIPLGNGARLSQGRTVGPLGGNPESQVAALSFSGKINFPNLLNFLERPIDNHSNFVRMKASNKKGAQTIHNFETLDAALFDREAPGVGGFFI